HSAPGRAGNNSAGASTYRSELSAALSASLRNELLREIEALNSNDDAALWAQQRLDAKNTLSAADAEHVGQVFQARLLKFVTAPGSESVPDKPEPSVRGRGRSNQRRRAAVVDKTVLALPTPRRIRDREHVKFVAKQPCLVCGRRPADA